eukprot:1137720-Pelagomonas_calceolata.AAC.3
MAQEHEGEWNFGSFNISSVSSAVNSHVQQQPWLLTPALMCTVRLRTFVFHSGTSYATRPMPRSS